MDQTLNESTSQESRLWRRLRYAKQRDPKSQTTTAEEINTAGLAFKAIVTLDAQNLQAMERRLPLAAGMSVSAEIIQDKRTVFEYLLSPVQRVVSEAGRER